MQLCGHPPEELVGSLPAGWALGDNGLPQVGSLCLAFLESASEDRSCFASDLFATDWKRTWWLSARRIVKRGKLVWDGNGWNWVVPCQLSWDSVRWIGFIEAQLSKQEHVQFLPRPVLAMNNLIFRFMTPPRTLLIEIYDSMTVFDRLINLRTYYNVSITSPVFSFLTYFQGLNRRFKKLSNDRIRTLLASALWYCRMIWILLRIPMDETWLFHVSHWMIWPDGTINKNACCFILLLFWARSLADWWETEGQLAYSLLCCFQYSV